MSTHCASVNNCKYLTNDNRQPNGNCKIPNEPYTFQHTLISLITVIITKTHKCNSHRLCIKHVFNKEIIKVVIIILNNNFIMQKKI